MGDCGGLGGGVEEFYAEHGLMVTEWIGSGRRGNFRVGGYPTGTQKIFTCVNYEASMNSRTESTDAREGKKL